jgi:hypothetical protein
MDEKEVNFSLSYEQLFQEAEKGFEGQWNENVR